MVSSPVQWKWIWASYWAWAFPLSVAVRCATSMRWAPDTSATWPSVTPRWGLCINLPGSCLRWPLPVASSMSDAGRQGRADGEDFLTTAVTESVLEEQRRQRLLNRSHKNLRRDVGRAVADYNMIEEGD